MAAFPEEFASLLIRFAIKEGRKNKKFLYLLQNDSSSLQSETLYDTPKKFNGLSLLRLAMKRDDFDRISNTDEFIAHDIQGIHRQ